MEIARGSKPNVVVRGSLEDLKKRKQEELDKGNFYPFIMLSYALLMYDGRGKLKRVDNKEFPNIKPTTISEFLK